MINIKMQSTNDVQKLSPKIAVIGVGGAGGNAVNNMIASNLEGCEFIVCNTDSQALVTSLAEDKVQLGVNITGGLGAGSKPDVGQAAAEESIEDVMRLLEGVNMVFVTCGMGGGTGTGAAPVIAKSCRQQGILTVGVVTKPFHFEGSHRMAQAEKGIEELQQYVDTLIVIPNQNLFRVANEKTTFAEAFKMADSVLQSGVRGVTDLMVRSGLVNLDFADIRTAMLQMGKAMMGTGEATGDKRAVEAAEAAINNPLLDDVSMKGANGVIINVTGGYDMTLFEADEACNRIRDEVDANANIIFGATFDDSMDGFMRVSIVATGIDHKEEKSLPGGTTGGGPNGGNRILSSGHPAINTTNAPRPISIAPSVAPSLKSTAAASLAGDISGQSQQKPISAMSGREVMQDINAGAGVPAPVSEVKSSSPIPGLFSKTITSEAAPQFSVPQSIDMFEQGEFADAPEASALRGSTVNNAFIPPKPMEPDMMIPEEGIGSHISSFHGTHINEESAETPLGLHLNPPKSVAPSPDHATSDRSPSLFERITGTVHHHIENLRDSGDSIKSSPSETSYSAPTDSGLRGVVGGAPSQGSLNISAPAGKPAVQLDDELDIPAFLRRQAN